MIYYIKGNMFDSPAQVLVNTVNTVGVMGKGLALTFKKVYPDMFVNYKRFCDHNDLTIGKLYLYKTKGKWILNFPTKTTWRKPSKIEYIEEGLKKFVSTYKSKNIKSIAFPMLGCGNGGLDFESEVKPLMNRYLSSLEGINIYVYTNNMTNFIEHENIDEMKKWLDSNIQNISAKEFKDDLIYYSNGIINKLTDDDSIEINGKIIDYLEILSFWDDLLMNNISNKDEIINRHFSKLDLVTLDLFVNIMKKIPYLDFNGITDNGEQLIMYQPQKNERSLTI